MKFFGLLGCRARAVALASFASLSGVHTSAVAQTPPAPAPEAAPDAGSPPAAPVAPAAPPTPTPPPGAAPSSPSAPTSPAPVDTAPAPADTAPPPAVVEAPAQPSDEPTDTQVSAPVEVTAEAQPIEASPAAAVDANPQAIEVTVVGTSVARAPGSVHVLRNSQMERFEYDDPHAVLAAVPGVYLRGEDGFGLRPNIGIRGVDPDRSAKLTLMEDGILFGPAPYAAPAAYYFPLITRMTQVLVVKGPSATSYGPQTIGGAVDLITRTIPTSLRGGADLTVGSYWHRKAHVYLGTTEGRLGVLLEGVHLANDGFKELPNGADTGFYRNEWMFKGAYNLDDSGATVNELRLKLTYSEELSNETYLGLSDADFEANPLQRYGASSLDQMKNHRTAFVLTHAYEPSETFKLTTSVYRHDYARTWRKVNRFGGADLYSVLQHPESSSNADFISLLTGEQDSMLPDQRIWIGPNEREFVSQGIESRLLWDVHTGVVAHRVGASARLHVDQINRRHSESPFNLVGGQPVPVGAGTPNSNSVTFTTVNEGQGQSLALSVGDAITWGELTVTPSARLEVIRLSLDDQLNAQSRDQWFAVPIPGLGVYYGLTEELGLLAGVHRGFSAPAPSVKDNSDDTERAWNFELGARYSGRKLHAELIGFFNEYQNLTGTCTFSVGCSDDMLDSTVSGGAARYFGFEAQVQHELEVGAGFKVPFHASYSFTHAEFRETFTSPFVIWREVEKGDEVPYVPTQQLNVAAGIAHKLGGADVALNYQGATREQPGQEPLSQVLHTDAQVTLDIAARYQISDAIQLYANVRNLFNSEYVVSHRPFGARPNAPRWFQLGAKFDL